MVLERDLVGGLRHLHRRFQAGVLAARAGELLGRRAAGSSASDSRRARSACARSSSAVAWSLSALARSASTRWRSGSIRSSTVAGLTRSPSRKRTSRRDTLDLGRDLHQVLRLERAERLDLVDDVLDQRRGRPARAAPVVGDEPTRRSGSHHRTSRERPRHKGDRGSADIRLTERLVVGIGTSSQQGFVGGDRLDDSRSKPREKSTGALAPTQFRTRDAAHPRSLTTRCARLALRMDPRSGARRMPDFSPIIAQAYERILGRAPDPGGLGGVEPEHERGPLRGGDARGLPAQRRVRHEAPRPCLRARAARRALRPRQSARSGPIPDVGPSCRTSPRSSRTAIASSSGAHPTRAAWPAGIAP